MEFDRRLVALCDCPVMRHNKEKSPEALGGIIFNPNPVITAVDDEVLAHELCHRLGGKNDYDIFTTAIIARESSELFHLILNLLLDCYHERKHELLSGFVGSTVAKSHKKHILDSQPIKKAHKLNRLVEFFNGMAPIEIVSKEFEVEIRDVIDLVVIADQVFEQAKKKLPGSKIKAMVDIFKLYGQKAAGGYDIGYTPKSSNYYVNAVSRYDEIIGYLCDMWKRNKYSWVPNYYGEINWKDLPGMLLGTKLSLPVFRIFSKIVLSRQIYLVIDRSSSTCEIKETVMDTAVIIAESLRRLNTPISILDVGPQNKIINKINEDIDLGWFTPTSRNGTPLGKVCMSIDDADAESYLIIVTDGIPDNMGTLLSALHKFPGGNLTFVIGPSYAKYASHIENVLSVEPHTIIKEMIRHEDMLNR